MLVPDGPLGAPTLVKFAYITAKRDKQHSEYPPPPPPNVERLWSNSDGCLDEILQGVPLLTGFNFNLNMDK